MFFGTMTVCAAGGPECHATVAEPSDFLGMAPYFMVFLFVALGSLAGGVIALRRPRAGAFVLLTFGVLGAGTILLFIPPFWTPLDLVAAGVAFAASRQTPIAAGPEPAKS
jgi:hypothetical protein